MKFYFVRHGESEANFLAEFSNGLGKHGLTEKGRRQALALAQTLRGAAITPYRNLPDCPSLAITQIFASPILRAVQTAEILARELQVPATTADALAEYDVGVLEGRADAASWQVYWQVTDAWLVRHEWDQRIEGGESFDDIRRRFVPFIERLVQEQRSAPGGIVLVGHGGTYRCMLPLVLRNIDFQFALDHPMGNTAAVIADVRSEGLVCTAWGEIVL